MHVKKYIAVNMREALNLVKKELGPDAVIISTRNIEQMSENGKYHAIEVTAALDSNIGDNTSTATRKRMGKISDEFNIQEIIDPLQKEISELKEVIKSISPDILGSVKKENDDSFKKEATELNSILQRLLNNNGTLRDLGIHESLIKLYRESADKGINQRLLFRLIESVNRKISKEVAISEDNIKARLFNEMMRSIKTSGPIKNGLEKPKAVAFVGPTGVGKTTTVAKLAAELSLNQKKEVALITLDTYRIAAVEQLKIYSRIIDLSLFVARDKKEFDEAIQHSMDKDVVLIDTAGRSRKDEKQMSELMDYLDGEIPVEIHLVLSSTDQEDVLMSNIKRFYPLFVDRLIFSKIDEANSFGMLFNVAVRTNKPISYFTTGQKVPEDIEVATAEKTIDLIFQ